MKTNSGYRLHIEADESEPTAYRTMKEVRKAQRDMVREYNALGKKNGSGDKTTFAELDKISYIVTEEEYQKSKEEE